MPFVAFGRSDVDAPHSWVDVDGAAGTRAAVAHLVARGHARIAYLGWPMGSVSGDQRALGYRQGLAAAGLTADAALDARGPDGTATGAAAYARWRALADPPTAVVAASDLLALGVLRAARADGVPVGPDGRPAVPSGAGTPGGPMSPDRPADPGPPLAVVGFDDTPVAPFTSPALTSVRQPLEAVAAHVARLLAAHATDPGAAPEGVALPPRLVVRDSA